MSHHSSDDPLTKMPKALLEMQKLKDSDAAGMFKREKSSLITEMKTKQLADTLGPTGDFPAGKIVPHDEGGLLFGVTVFNGRVILDFGKPIRSIGFTRNETLEFAKLLKIRAKSCPQIIGEKEPE